MRSVSIIIVNFNGAHHLRECLESVKHADYSKNLLEVIIFDNGSSDNSIETALNVYPNAKIISNPTNIGFASPHEICAKQAKGEILAFINNDMRVHRDWIKEGTQMLDRSQDIICVSSKVMDWNGENIDFFGGTFQYLGYAKQLQDDTLKNGDYVLFPCGGAMFIEKDVFIEADCFDGAYFAIFEDVDLGWRLWLMGYKVVLSEKSIVYHKGHGTLDTKRVSKKRFLMHRNALMTIIKNYDDENLAKILPMALLLSIKRTIINLGIDKKSFYFWEEDTPEATQPEDYVESCINLAALDDVFTSFDKLMIKRKQVQSRRTRMDTDIFPLFKDPFRNIMGYKEYLWDETTLFGNLKLEELFNCRQDYEKRVEEGLFHARHALKEMRREIYDTQVAFSSAPVLSRDSKLIMDKANKFYLNLKVNGFAYTMKKTGNFFFRRNHK